MKLILYTRVVSNVYFQPVPFIDKLKKKMNNWQLFDLDNHSSNLVVQMAVKAIKESERIIFIIDVEETEDLNGILKLIQQLQKVKRSAEVSVSLIGNHPIAEKLVPIIDDGFQKFESKEAFLQSK